MISLFFVAVYLASNKNNEMAIQYFSAADLTGSSLCSIDEDCDDGLFCNGPETCVDGSCQSGTAPSCSDFCSNALGSCVACLSDGDCNNGDLCSGIFCNTSGSCQSGAAVNCDDGVGCTVDFVSVLKLSCCDPYLMYLT